MTDEIDVRVVVQAAREWAVKLDKNDAMAAADALSELSKLHTQYQGDALRREVEKLYRKYSGS